jgi:hypothetical protein
VRWLLGQVDDRCARPVRLDRLDALLGVGFGFVSLAGGDDFTVRGLEVKPEFAGSVLADFELGLQFSLFVCLNSENATSVGLLC